MQRLPSLQLVFTGTQQCVKMRARGAGGGDTSTSPPRGGMFAVRIRRQLSTQQIAKAFHDTVTLSSFPPSPQLLVATISGMVKHPH